MKVKHLRTGCSTRGTHLHAHTPHPALVDCEGSKVVCSRQVAGRQVASYVRAGRRQAHSRLPSKGFNDGPRLTSTQSDGAINQRPPAHIQRHTQEQRCHRMHRCNAVRPAGSVQAITPSKLHMSLQPHLIVVNSLGLGEMICSMRGGGDVVCDWRVCPLLPFPSQSFRCTSHLDELALEQLVAI